MASEEAGKVERPLDADSAPVPLNEAVAPSRASESDDFELIEEPKLEEPKLEELELEEPPKPEHLATPEEPKPKAPEIEKQEMEQSKLEAAASSPPADAPLATSIGAETSVSQIPSTTETEEEKRHADDAIRIVAEPETLTASRASSESFEMVAVPGDEASSSSDMVASPELVDTSNEPIQTAAIQQTASDTPTAIDKPAATASTADIEDKEAATPTREPHQQPKTPTLSAPSENEDQREKGNEKLSLQLSPLQEPDEQLTTKQSEDVELADFVEIADVAQLQKELEAARRQLVDEPASIEEVEAPAVEQPKAPTMVTMDVEIELELPTSSSVATIEVMLATTSEARVEHTIEAARRRSIVAIADALITVQRLEEALASGESLDASGDQKHTAPVDVEQLDAQAPRSPGDNQKLDVVQPTVADTMLESAEVQNEQAAPEARSSKLEISDRVDGLIEPSAASESSQPSIVGVPADVAPVEQPKTVPSVDFSADEILPPPPPASIQPATLAESELTRSSETADVPHAIIEQVAEQQEQKLEPNLVDVQQTIAAAPEAQRQDERVQDESVNVDHTAKSPTKKRQDEDAIAAIDEQQKAEQPTAESEIEKVPTTPPATVVLVDEVFARAEEEAANEAAIAAAVEQAVLQALGDERALAVEEAEQPKLEAQIAPAAAQPTANVETQLSLAVDIAPAADLEVLIAVASEERATAAAEPIATRRRSSAADSLQPPSPPESQQHQIAEQKAQTETFAPIAPTTAIEEVQIVVVKEQEAVAAPQPSPQVEARLLANESSTIDELQTPDGALQKETIAVCELTLVFDRPTTFSLVEVMLGVSSNASADKNIRSSRRSSKVAALEDAAPVEIPSIVEPPVETFEIESAKEATSTTPTVQPKEAAAQTPPQLATGDQIAAAADSEQPKEPIETDDQQPVDSHVHAIVSTTAATSDVVELRAHEPNLSKPTDLEAEIADTKDDLREAARADMLQTSEDAPREPTAAAVVEAPQKAEANLQVSGKKDGIYSIFYLITFLYRPNAKYLCLQNMSTNI